VLKNGMLVVLLASWVPSTALAQFGSNGIRVTPPDGVDFAFDQVSAYFAVPDPVYLQSPRRGAVVLFQTKQQFALQRVRGNGRLLWPDAPKLLPFIPFPTEIVEVLSDGEGGLLVIYSSINQVRATSIDPQGNQRPGWPVEVDATRDHIWPDGRGGILVDKLEGSGFPPCSVEVQRYGAEGNRMWGGGFRQSANCFASPYVRPDGRGGAYIVDTREEDSGYDNVLVYHVTADGEIDSTWPASGVPIAPSIDAHRRIGDVIVHANGNLFVQFTVDGEDPQRAQTISPEGQRAWGSEGLVLWPGVNALMSDGLGGIVFVTYPGNTRTFVRLDASGGHPWGDGIIPPRCANMGVPDGAGGVTLVGPTNDSVSGLDVCGSHIQANGTIDEWSEISLCSAADGQEVRDVVPDGNGGLIALWTDRRHRNAVHIYAGWLSPSGAVPVTLTDMRVISDARGVQVSWTTTSTSPLLCRVQRSDTQEGPFSDISADIFVPAGSARHEVMDESAVASGRYYYRITYREGDTWAASPVQSVQVAALHLNVVPLENPARGEARFVVTRPGSTDAWIGIYDVAGRLIWKSVMREPTQVVVWNGRDRGHGEVPAGVFLVRVEQGSAILDRKFVFIR